MPEVEPSEKDALQDPERQPSWADRNLTRVVFGATIAGLVISGGLAYRSLQPDGQSEVASPEETSPAPAGESTEGPFSLSVDFLDGGVQLSPALAVLIGAGIWLAITKK